MRFQDKTVVVTGSARGIGAETARRFAAEGARVAVVDINGTEAETVAAGIPGAIAITSDVASRGQVAAMVRQVISNFGRIDVLINNAMSCTDKAFLDLTSDDIFRDFQVCVIGAFFTCQEVVPLMRDSGGGVILNVSSVNGNTFCGNEAYSAAKAGLQSLTKAIAIQFGQYGIRCNAVAPGTVATEVWQRRVDADPDVMVAAARWYPLGRVGVPNDVAQALMFLASDAAAWITGVVVPVDGGLLTGNLEFARSIVPPLRDVAV